MAKFEELSAPLTPVQNTKLRPRQQSSSSTKKTTEKKGKKRGRAAKFSNRKQKKSRYNSTHYRKQIVINSDWQPVDAGQIVDVRLGHETQSQKRRCYNAIRHSRELDEIIRIRDCVKVRSSEGSHFYAV